MTGWHVALWGIALVGAPAVLYGLHRLCLWLESRGLLFYLNRKPEGGGVAGSLAELQKVLDPTAKHVHRVREQRRHRSAGEAPGQDDSHRDSQP